MRVRDCPLRVSVANAIVKEENICEAITERLQTVFTTEETFTEASTDTPTNMGEEIIDQGEGMLNLMSLDVRKAVGPDEMAG